MERLLEDLRFGVRSLVKSPRFTIAAVLTLALGIGANAAIFTVIHSVLLKSWPFPDAGRLVIVTQRQPNGSINLFSTKDLLDWKQQGGLLADLGAHVSSQFNLSAPGTPPERIAGSKLSHDWLATLGVQPKLGRLFSAQEDVAGSGNFVILSSALWRSRYGADPHILGKPIQLDQAPYTIVGVMPAGFNGFDGKELLWTPLQLRSDTGPGASPNIHWLSACIRLPRGISLKQAQTELDSIAARLRQQDPSGDAGYGVFLQSLNDALTSNVRPALLMLMCCVGFVLLIACANVANLQLARGAARQRDMALRAALGASSSRIIRQLLTESVLLAGASGALAIGMAAFFLRGMLTVHRPTVPGIDEIGIDSTVLSFSLALSLVVGILFGLVPALEASRLDVNESLREHGGGEGRGTGHRRSVLVVTETALACMLLVGTGLALRSLWSLKGVQLGLVPQQLLVFRIAAPAELSGSRISGFYRQVADQVRAVPGVESAAVARDLPLAGVDPSMPITVEGQAPPLPQGGIVTRYRAIGDGYFRTLQILVLNGRAFDQRDTATAPSVAMVSESLAKEYWPGQNAVGKRIKPAFKGSSWCIVVGVVADVRHWGADVAVEPTAYYPYDQVPDSMRPLVEANMAIAVRSRLPQDELLPAIRNAVAAVNSGVPVYDVNSMESLLAGADSLRNFDLWLLGAFSLLALILASVGVYAVMAYSVSRRTREIGIRLALGATARDVLGLVLGQGAKLAIAGSLIGVASAFALRKLMANYLYGLSANDPLVLCLVPCTMVGIILLACWLPAIRATRVDPTVALHYE